MSDAGHRGSVPYDPAPLPVEEAVEMYLNRRRSDSDTTVGTVETHLKRLNYLIEFCELEDIENICDLRGHHLERYREWRRTEATTKVESLAAKTIAEHMKTIRVFLRSMEQMEYVYPGMADRVHVPGLSDEDEVNEDILEYDRAQNILSYIAKSEPWTADHSVWELFVRNGVRLCTARAPDIEDYHSEADVPYIELHHRPDTDTRLKNGTDSERKVFLEEQTAKVLDRYIEHNHPKETDKHGRMPLIGTVHGRPNKSTIRGMVYKWTRPCHLNKPCPHGKTPDNCEAASSRETPSACPSMRSPHPIRKGYVTHLAEEGVPPRIVGDRVDADPEVLKKHYDQSDDEAKMRVRQELIEHALDDADEENWY
ncbi:site-specific integrase [Halarchaeum sp. CBA1220]|uniref:tyrosine-type recombinase/integrase n=1 Tax=Halarchaeum sp. CBA1220 TaxID=1853682 RepID=UPI000F3A9BA8|nr:phage integrase SAM-like domain-containing protein [Halarchaeum sp. CBA1220]QLC34339.1 site-specific integrase [Halarchaeum sp. CBA1220]